VRSDKFTLAALEATLSLYRDPDTARRDIPVLRMLTEEIVEVRRRAEALQRAIGEEAQLIDGDSEVGGGSFPGAKLKTWLVRLSPDTRHLSPDTLAQRLREAEPPIVARIQDGHVVLDPRTILPEQTAIVSGAVRAALDA
jgi:L-seryl-tRNA(Ser) seleniumtransferase